MAGEKLAVACTQLQGDCCEVLWVASWPFEHHLILKAAQEFLGTLVIVVTSEGLVRIDDRKSRGTGGNCESDSNKCEDFFHGRILSKMAV